MKMPLGRLSAIALAIASMLSSVALSGVASADTLARWTFETVPPADVIDSQTIGGIAADVGAGTGGGFHSNSSTDWTTPAGNGSANSLAANIWSTDDYFSFTFSTVGYEDVTIQFDLFRESTAPGAYHLYQDLGSELRTITGSVGFSSGAWMTSAVHGVGSPAFNLSNATFRLVLEGGGAGEVRVDNFTVSATAVPETSPFVYGGLISLALCAWRWRQNRLRDEVRV